MDTRLDIADKKFGMITVVSFAGTVKHLSTWNCVCDCGAELVVVGRRMTRAKGAKTNCGCVRKAHALLNSTKKPVKVRLPAKERLMQAVSIDTNTGCWNWTLSAFKGGYGAFRIDNGKQVSAHRAAYQLLVGPIPEGIHVLHKCDNPRCVNPYHLWLGTHRENMLDKMNKGRDNVKGRTFKRTSSTDQRRQCHSEASTPA